MPALLCFPRFVRKHIVTNAWPIVLAEFYLPYDRASGNCQIYFVEVTSISLVSNRKEWRMTTKGIYATLVGLSILFTTSSLAKANPHDGVVPCRYKANDGNVYTAYQDFSGSVWFVGESTYCAANHTTSAGNRYDHSHMGAGFPFQDTLRNNEQVTQAKADSGYDSDLNGWTKQSGATFQTNCHSYALGYTTAILSTQTGSVRV